MLLLKHVFTILHIITAAAWFGMGLRLATQARTALLLDKTAALGLIDDTQRTIRFMGIFIMLTAVFAFTTLGIGISMVRYGAQYHIASLLIVILVALQFGMIRPAWNRLRDAVAGGGDGEAQRKRVAMSMGIGHLTWFVLLVLMFWDKLRGAAM
jgi:hypothetical protein